MLLPLNSVHVVLSQSRYARHGTGIVVVPFPATPWRLWYDTDGAQGEEPLGVIKELFDLSTEWTVTPRDTPRYAELSHELITINTENLFFFGTVSISPRVVIVNIWIGNMQGEGGNPSYIYHYFVLTTLTLSILSNNYS